MKVLTIGFITKGGSISVTALDHIVPICKHIAQNGKLSIRPIIYVLNGVSQELKALREHVEIRFIDENSEQPWNAPHSYVGLKLAMIEDGVKIACYTHAFDALYFLFGMRLAPVQIHFSQYFHPVVESAEIDEYMTWGTPALKRQVFALNPWRVVPSCLAASLDDVDPNAIRQLRSSLGGSRKLILATLARIEKVNQAPFLSAVSEILRNRPNCLFIWTGQLEHPEVTRAFESAGVIEQTRFHRLGRYAVVLQCHRHPPQTRSPWRTESPLSRRWLNQCLSCPYGARRRY